MGFGIWHLEFKLDYRCAVIQCFPLLQIENHRFAFTNQGILFPPVLIKTQVILTFYGNSMGFGIWHLEFKLDYRCAVIQCIPLLQIENPMRHCRIVVFFSSPP
jgi:hypothetical protein